MTTENQNELAEIKKEAEIFVEHISTRISNLCNKLDYIKGSQLSYSIDRAELFLNDLKEN